MAVFHELDPNFEWNEAGVIAKHATSGNLFAFAANRLGRHIERAFQASSPK
ncbi:hypothetical protein NSU_0795 [Novosphingobium pentaromativorans US6-1]|uniref:Uncharacterized protein n=1 Tax=Novosphingobium pentaromativorans US6-1 TaxID=1088721 RepID=G6E8X4_9SPHN|nr:hypothetical protein NSU_0795 [Novosphingobium pentaromativorans US6-1]